MGDLSKDINSTFPSEKVKALINIKYTANWLDKISNKFLDPFHISVQQYNILRILKGAKEAVTVQTVKDRMIEKSPNATRLMDKLCAKNLIERSRCDSDRRAVYVKIADLGLKMLEDIDMDNVSDTIANISEEEAKLLNSLLDKIR